MDEKHQLELFWALQTIRNARYAVLANSEDWDSLFHAIENVSRLLIPQKQKNKCLKIRLDFLFQIFEKQYNKEEKKNYERLSYLVRDDRNSAMHEGAQARKLVSRLLEYSGLIELGLMRNMSNTIKSYMVTEVTKAEVWHPLRLIRQNMLNNSYSWIPIFNKGEWYLISDYSVARILKSNSSNRECIDSKVEDLWEELRPIKATYIDQETEIDIETLDCTPAKGPILVFEPNGYPDRLVGLITAFDLL